MSFKHLSFFYLIQLLCILKYSIQHSQYQYYTRNPFTAYLELNVKYHNSPTPSTEICFGSHKQALTLYLSTLDNTIHVSNYAFSLSSAYETDNTIIPLDFISQGLKGKYVKDLLTFSYVNLQHFPFIYIKDEDVAYFYKGSLGLGYHFPKSHLETNVEDNDSQYQNSLLYQLKKAKYIDQYIISFTYSKKSSILILGEYPRNYPLKPNQFNYKACPLIQTDNDGNPNRLWQCRLDSIYFEDNSLFHYGVPITLSLGGSLMNVPQEFFQYIVDRYFTAALNQKDCYISHIRFKQIVCYKLDLVALKEMNIVFGKWTLKLNRDMLFKYIIENDEYKLMIVYSLNHFKDRWTLGLNMLDLMNNQVIFDGDKKEFGLLYHNFKKEQG